MPSPRPPTVADLIQCLDHGGLVTGAERLGEAVKAGRIVRLGLWLDPAGGVRRARWKATTCPALMAYAEMACRLLEQGHDPATLDEPLGAAIAGVHPQHRSQAALVTQALRAALAHERNPPP